MTSSVVVAIYIYLIRYCYCYLYEKKKNNINKRYNDDDDDDGREHAAKKATETEHRFSHNRIYILCIVYYRIEDALRKDIEYITHQTYIVYLS